MTTALTISVPEACAVLGIHENTGYRQLAETGRIHPDLPALRIRGRWRIPTIPLERLLDPTAARVASVSAPSRAASGSDGATRGAAEAHSSEHTRTARDAQRSAARRPSRGSTNKKARSGAVPPMDRATDGEGLSRQSGAA